ncbi:MAG: hypothetical protein JXA96_13810 [Sedimentisphaerales bacterium]|nr:hypothetical protein [Sedimentisphaerales bacterium]
MKKQLNICVKINAVIIIFLAFYIFIIPGLTMMYDLHDPGLYGTSTPRFVFRWHKSLSGKYEKWAKERVSKGIAANLTTQNISGTEWPVFGSVFYLWATESLQAAYDDNPKLSKVAPKEYASGAIEAAAALVADPNHANWVKLHWGDKYLETENLFYRMLLISGLTSYQKLTENKKNEDLLRWQVESLAKEFDESPYGVIDDYPGQCYPVDIVPAIAAIKRADSVLGTDHSDFVKRAVRGFEDTRLDDNTGLPGYIVSSRTGQALESARGVGISFMLIWAPEIWPETASDWYNKYEKQFWMRNRWIAGFREFPRNFDVGRFFFADVDAGPVIRGFGAGASAFAIGATRAMGRLDHAYPLAAEAVALSWPLPNGTLLIPRMLSNMSDAPYLGESAMVFSLSRKAVTDNIVTAKGKVPWIVYIEIIVFLSIGTYVVKATLYKIKTGERLSDKYIIQFPMIQIAIWSFLIIFSVIIMIGINIPMGIVFMLLAQLVPFPIKNKMFKIKSD